MKRRRLPTWFYSGKLTFTAAFALGLSVLMLTGMGIFWVRTRPVLVWSDYDVLGIRSFGTLECPERLQAGVPAQVCLSVDLPEKFSTLLETPQEVILVTQGQGPFDSQINLPIGKNFSFEPWFSPVAGETARWCRQVEPDDFLEWGGRFEHPILLVVTVPVNFSDNAFVQVLGSCSILLENPRSAGVFLFRLGAIVLSAANLFLVGLAWVVAYRSLRVPPGKAWKVLLLQAVFIAVVILFSLGIVGPVNYDTGTMFFHGDRQVFQADFRARGMGILVAAFLLAVWVPVIQRLARD